MDKYAKLTGRQYKLYEYVGPADADRHHHHGFGRRYR